MVRIYLILLVLLLLLEPRFHTNAEIIVPPVDTEAPISSFGLFECIASVHHTITGYKLLTITWKILLNGDEYYCQEMECISKQITARTTSDPSGENNKTSTLNITVVDGSYNQANIQCLAFYSNGGGTNKQSLSETVTLTALGVGEIKQLTYDEDSHSLSWNEPFTSEDDLQYRLSVTNTATGEEFMILLTNNTFYNLTFLPPCFNYSITVTPYAPGLYNGTPYTTVIFRQGACPEIDNVTLEIIIWNPGKVNVTAIVRTNEHCKQLQLLCTVLLIPDAEKEPLIFASKTTMVTDTLMVSLSFTLPSDGRYLIIFSLLNLTDAEVFSRDYSISTYDVQGASSPTIKRENKTNKICTALFFASGSTSNGLVEFRRQESEHFYRATLEQEYTSQIAFGCVNVSPDDGVYTGSVYDVEGDVRSTSPAYIFTDRIHVSAVDTGPPPTKATLPTNVSTGLSDGVIAVAVIVPICIVIIGLPVVVALIKAAIYIRKKRRTVEPGLHDLESHQGEEGKATKNPLWASFSRLHSFISPKSKQGKQQNGREGTKL